jgi:hypothetical protein
VGPANPKAEAGIETLPSVVLTSRTGLSILGWRLDRSSRGKKQSLPGVGVCYSPQLNIS